MPVRANLRCDDDRTEIASAAVNATRPTFLEIDFDGRSYDCVAILDAPGAGAPAAPDANEPEDAMWSRERVAEALRAVAGRSKLVVELDDGGVATVNGVHGWRITSTRFQLSMQPATQPFELHYHPRYALDGSVPYVPAITVYAISQAAP